MVPLFPKHASRTYCGIKFALTSCRGSNAESLSFTPVTSGSIRWGGGGETEKSWSAYESLLLNIGNLAYMSLHRLLLTCFDFRRLNIIYDYIIDAIKLYEKSFRRNFDISRC